MKLNGRSEFQIIDFIRSRCRLSPELLQGIGDDCAVAGIPEGHVLLTTTDLLAEGIHFDQRWSDLFTLGRKSVSVNVSDLAAMGARPRFLFLSLAIPETLQTEDIEQFISGFMDACESYGAVLAGGDTCASKSGLVVSVTAQGITPESAWIPRSGAREGDAVYVTGTLGDSALALRHLLAAEKPDPFLLRRHIDPEARSEIGAKLAAAAVPTAMVDVSDGLIGDFEHILEESETGGEIDLTRLPLSKGFQRELADTPGLIELALTGGEDYELLFAAPPEHETEIARMGREIGTPISRIGKIHSAGFGLKLFDHKGEVPLPHRSGYKHFSETT